MNAQRQAVYALYDEVLHVANRFLHQAKNYSISVLRLENPTYAEIAKQFREVAEIISFLADKVNEPLLGDKANDYITCMEEIAKAIEEDNSEALDRVVTYLEKRPFL